MSKATKVINGRKYNLIELTQGEKKGHTLYFVDNLNIGEKRAALSALKPVIANATKSKQVKSLNGPATEQQSADPQQGLDFIIKMFELLPTFCKIVEDQNGKNIAPTQEYFDGIEGDDADELVVFLSGYSEKLFSEKKIQ